MYLTLSNNKKDAQPRIWDNFGVAKRVMRPPETRSAYTYMKCKEALLSKRKKKNNENNKRLKEKRHSFK